MASFTWRPRHVALWGANANRRAERAPPLPASTDSSVKSWTRTLNVDDAHTLLALTRPGLSLEDWIRSCRPCLKRLSADRQREVLRLLRDGFLECDGRTIRDGLFLRFYTQAPASAQLDLVQLQWALTHPISLIAVDRLVAPALARGAGEIPLAGVEALVRAHVDTDSAESLRKTRTVLLNALDGVGAMVTRGTGQHRSIRASRGVPHPLAFGYLLVRELLTRGGTMRHAEAVASSLPVRLTQCEPGHAARCVGWNVEQGRIALDGDTVALR